MHQKGNIGLIIVIVVALLAVVGGGYIYFKNNGGAKEMLKPRVSEKDFSFITDPDVRKHFAAQLNQDGYRIKSMSSGKGTTDVMEFQIKGNDVVYHTVSYDGNKELSNMIVIGDTTYLKDPKDNMWWKQTAKTTPETTGEPQERTVKDEVKQITDKYSEKEAQVTYKKLGEEPCGNLTCFKYEEVSSQNVEAKRTFWFDTKDYLLRKEEYGFGEFKSTNEYEYDNITITAPSPTKDVPEGKNIYEYMQVSNGTTGVPTGYEKMMQEQDVLPSTPPAPPDSNSDNVSSDDSGY